MAKLALEKLIGTLMSFWHMPMITYYLFSLFGTESDPGLLPRLCFDLLNNTNRESVKIQVQNIVVCMESTHFFRSAF